jgi:hypothetical protein
VQCLEVKGHEYHDSTIHALGSYNTWSMKNIVKCIYDVIIIQLVLPFHGQQKYCVL